MPPHVCSTCRWPLDHEGLGNRVFPGAEAFIYHGVVSDGAATQADTGTDPTSAVPRRRIPPWTLVLALWLAAGAAFPTPPLLDAATGQVPTGVYLTRPLAYLVFAPAFGLLDLLTFLTPAQHFALITTVLGLFVGIRTTARRRGRSRRPGWQAWGAVLAGVLAVYVVGAALPRPTPRVTATDPNVVRVNFHSHTRHSHDVGSGYTAEWSRAWHARTGFDAGFVSDHRTWDGVREAAASNPSRAGDGVLLMSGVEVWFRHQHAIGIGDSTRYNWTMDPERRRFEVDSILGYPPPSPLTLLFALPGDLDDIHGLAPGTPAGVVGIEIIDGSPLGLYQSRVDRRRILDLADSLDLALVSGGNGHGYGQAAAAWSLVHVPGWRDLDAEGLAAALEQRLQRDRREAVTVVERPVPGAAGEWQQVLAAPVLAWHLTRSLSTGERAAWLFWLLVSWAFLARPSARSHREPTREP